MKKMNLFFILLSILILFHNIPILANTTSINEEIYIQELSLGDIDKYEDIKQYIQDNNTYNSFYEGKEFMNSIIENDTISRLNKMLADNNIEETINKEDFQEIISTYGLSKLEDITSIQEKIVVTRDIQTERISNVWYLNYSLTKDNLYINIFNIGFDPIDRIGATLYLYGIDGYNWKNNPITTRTFVKTNVTNGNVFTWTIPSEYVKEKVEYIITINEDGYTYKYSNVDKDDLIRINSDAKSYSSLNAKGGERHHLISQSTLKKFGYSIYSAYCIRMTKKDHTLTGNYGNFSSSINFRKEEEELLKNKKYVELIQKEVNDLKNTNDPDGLSRNLADKYNDPLITCIFYYQKMFGI